jgi:hypothetical protein
MKSSFIVATIASVLNVAGAAAASVGLPYCQVYLAVLPAIDRIQRFAARSSRSGWMSDPLITTTSRILRLSRDIAALRMRGSSN